MSYANVLAHQAKDVFGFAVVTRRKYMSGASLTNAGSSKYYFSWSLGKVRGVTLTGGASSDPIGTAVLTEGSDVASLTTQQFFEDTVNGRLYVYNNNVTTNFETIISDVDQCTFHVEYETRYATTELNFYEIPTDDTTDLVRWKDGMMEVPTVTRSVVDNYSGFAPSSISPLKIAHAGSDLWESFHDDSFYQAHADVWICVGPLRSENCRKVFTGNISNVTASDVEMTFDLIENVGILSGTYNGRFFNNGDWTSIDPGSVGQPIPLAFGTPRWIKCVNLDYIQEGATTSDNRIWGVYETLNIDSGTFNTTLGTVTGSGPYTVTGMAESDVRKMNVGDYVRRISDDKWARITDIASATSIELTTISAHTPGTGNSYQRPAVQEIYFQVPSKQGYVQNWKIYDSTTVSCSSSNDVVTIELTAGFEAAATNLAIATIDPDDFEVWARVCGSPANETFEGTYINPVGASHMVTCLYWYLKKIVRLSETEIDGDSFVTAAAARAYAADESLGKSVAYFVHPMWTQDFEDHQTVIARLLQQIGAVAYFDEDGKFKIVARTVLGTADYTLLDSDIIGAPRWEIRHDDIKGLILDGSTINYGVPVTILKTKPSTTTTTIQLANSSIGEIDSNTYGRSRGPMPFEPVQLYDIGKDTTSGGRYLYRDGLNRMSDYFCDRRLTCKLRASGEILDVAPGDVVSLTREFIPGTSYVPGTNQTLKMFVLEVLRDGSAVEMILEDQYSIEQLGSF